MSAPTIHPEMAADSRTTVPPAGIAAPGAGVPGAATVPEQAGAGQRS
ncbi:MAG: hypothetical protein QOK35_2413, partial [Pseudonocardiales bacterium]|nr:hypothetical protein [Pseudonocardiales bacterium]